jgi:chromosome segregation protein
MASFDTQSLESEISTLSLEIAAVTEELSYLDDERSSLQEQITEQKEQISRLSQEWQVQREHMQTTRENFASLEALQADALGKNENDINAWLASNNLSLASRLAQEIKVDKGWEKAVETVLGFRLETVCIDSLDAINGKIQEIKQGAITLIGKTANGSQTANDDLLLNKVSCDWPLESFLAGVYAAANLQQALAMQGHLQPHESVVSPDGVWFGPHWVRSSQAHSEGSGLLEREQLIKELSIKLNGQSELVGLTEEQLQQAKATLQSLEETRENVMANRNDISRKQAELKAQISGKQARFDSLRNRQERGQTELNEVQQQLERDQAEVESSRVILHQALAATEGHDVERDELINQRDTHRIRLEDNRKQARSDREASHEVELRCQAMRTQLRATQENLSRIERQLEHTERRRTELKEALCGGEGPIHDMQLELETQLEKRLEVEHRLVEVRKTVEEIDHSLRELNSQRLEHEQLVQVKRVELDQYRLSNQELKVRRQTILEQIVEASYQVETLLNQMPEEATEAAWVERLEGVSRSSQRLGAINLAAIDEFSEQSERKQYLDAQFTDLTDALTTLENAIQKIDKETRTRFKDTFDKINVGIQEKFPRLFGGGHAYLEMTGDDLLETGVSIMARPPGKKNSTIHLLSGGEKALTAVAMVFSIFELNPSPFCMLDEVDAPLDDANVGRFCEVVKEMSNQVQFIFITHNKVTMEMAHQLMGVTMHEPGVSRIVAVDIDEAVELAVAS